MITNNLSFTIHQLQNLNKPTEKAIIHVLQQTFTDRVIHKVGLVISLYDVVSIGEGAVYPSDGGAHYKVTFRAIVFRPFPNELITGYVKEMNEYVVNYSTRTFFVSKT